MDPWSTYWWYNQQGGQQPPPPQQPAYFVPTAQGHPAQPPPPPPWLKQAQAKHAAPAHAIPGTQQLVDNFYSRKFPELHPTLAIDTCAVAYDIRKPPQDGILHVVFHGVGGSPAMRKDTKHLRLISKDFPWQLDIVQPNAAPITVHNVWQSLNEGLQVEIADSEWGCLTIYDKRRAEHALRAADRRGRKKDGPLLRCDWLGEHTIFKGLDRDNDYTKRRLLPTQQACEDTWVVKMN